MLEAGKKLQSFMPEVTAITSSLCLAYGAGRGSSVFKSKASTHNKNNTYTCVSVYDAHTGQRMAKTHSVVFSWVCWKWLSDGQLPPGSQVLGPSCCLLSVRFEVIFKTGYLLYNINIYIFSSNIIVKLDILSASFWAWMRPDFLLGHLAGKIPKMPHKCFLDASTYFPDAPRCFQRFPRCLPAPLSPMCHGHLPTGAPGENQLFMFWCLCIWST